MRLRVLPQLVEECWLPVAGPVHRSQTAIVLRDVSVTATAIIRVNNRFGVDVGKSLRGLRLLNHERTFTR